MTLERVTVDLAQAFEPSQIYVACKSRREIIHLGACTDTTTVSRAKSLQGLTVTSLPRNLNLGGANEQVKEFMQTRFPKDPLAAR